MKEGVWMKNRFAAVNHSLSRKWDLGLCESAVFHKNREAISPMDGQFGRVSRVIPYFCLLKNEFMKKRLYKRKYQTFLTT